MRNTVAGLTLGCLVALGCNSTTTTPDVTIAEGDVTIAEGDVTIAEGLVSLNLPAMT